MSVADLPTSFEAPTAGTITDFQYSPSGSSLAVADSEGFVQIFIRQGNHFVKASDFRADEASIWRVSWADPKFGSLIAIASFNSKVSIFQETGQGWREIAYHTLHEASVNWVEWAPGSLKLFAGSSDGSVSILEVLHKQWKAHSFKVTEASIVCLALQPTPFGEVIAEQTLESFYPRLAVASKGQSITIWVHQSEGNYCEDVSHLGDKEFNKSGYALLSQFRCEKETIKNLIWRPSWGTLSQALKEFSLVYCTEEGTLKSVSWGEEGIHSTLIEQRDIPFTRVSESLTGGYLAASTAVKGKLETVIFEEEGGAWRKVRSGSL